MLRIPVVALALPITLLFSVAFEISAQSTASIEGRVIDQQGAVIPGVRILARSAAIGVERTATSDNSGRYQFAALPIGDYTLEASATGFRSQIVENLVIEVGRRITQGFELQIGDVSETVTITSNTLAIELSTTSVGHE